MPQSVVIRKAKSLVVKGDVDVQVDRAVLIEDGITAKSTGFTEEVERVQVVKRASILLASELLLKKWTIRLFVQFNLFLPFVHVVDEVYLVVRQLDLVVHLVVLVHLVLEVVEPLWEVHLEDVELLIQGISLLDDVVTVLLYDSLDGRNLFLYLHIQVVL